MLPRRCLAVVLVAMLWPPVATRPDQGGAPAITGRVVDAQDGSALPAVSLRLGRQGSPELEIIVETDIRGVYALRDLAPADDYVISVDEPGFAPTLVSPIVVSGSTVRLDIMLRSEALTTEVSIGSRWLDDVEKQLYLDGSRNIAETLRARGSPTIGLVVWALRQIQDLPEVVREDVRDALQSTIAETLTELVEPGDPFIFELLRDPDPVIQSMAIHILFNQDAGRWLQDPDLRAHLQEILGAPVEHEAILRGILIAYVFAERFGEVRSIALDLARGAEAEPAREAASVIAWSHERSGDAEGLRRLFHESGGVLRQETAIWLAASFEETLTAAERSQVAWELARTMEDPSLSPEFRGDAIRVARSLRTHPVIHDALLGLLAPDAWFSGVPAVCHPRHSLAAVLDSLDVRPTIAGDLLVLRDRLELLEADDRHEVAVAIDEILLELSRLRHGKSPGATAANGRASPPGR